CSADRLTADAVLAMMAGLENGSSHPLAVGILAAAKEHQLTPKVSQDVHQITGVGLSGTIDGQTYQIVVAPTG
ncbi:hypothetical protein WP50_39240, partial [Lactiplantibacillus plantarum]